MEVGFYSGDGIELADVATEQVILVGAHEGGLQCRVPGLVPGLRGQSEFDAVRLRAAAAEILLLLRSRKSDGEAGVSESRIS